MADIADHANDIIEHQRAEALARHRSEADMLQRVEIARRARMPEDAAHCTACGQPIGEERLRALPLTSRCVSCAGLAEALYREKAWMPR